jgi:hypothetical protein
LRGDTRAQQRNKKLTHSPSDIESCNLG